jgi:hypothetical protein
MEFIQNPVFLLLFILLIAFLIRYFKPKKMSKSELKGLEGERLVSEVLKKKKVRYFTDVLLEIGTHTTQIDHLVIFPDKTVLVIETKNKDGVILGKADEQNWTQYFPGQSFQFYNPVKQNEGHIRFLHRFCDSKKIYGMHFINLVVFTSKRSSLKNVPENTIQLHQLESFIDFYNRKSFWNRSKQFNKTIKLNDQSRNKKKVKKHLDFAKNAKKFTK